MTGATFGSARSATIMDLGTSGAGGPPSPNISSMSSRILGSSFTPVESPEVYFGCRFGRDGLGETWGRCWCGRDLYDRNWLGGVVSKNW